MYFLCQKIRGCSVLKGINTVSERSLAWTVSITDVLQCV